MEWVNSFGLSAVLLIAALASVYLGISVVRSDDSPKYRWFFVVAVSAALWALSNVVFVIAPLAARPIVALASYSIATILVIGFLKFCLSISTVKSGGWLEKIYVTLGIVVATLSAVPGVILLGIVEETTIQTRPTMLVVYGAYVAIGIIAGVSSLVRTYYRSTKQEKQRIIVIMAGLAVGASVGLIGNLIMPMMGNYEFVQVGPLGVLIFVWSSYYAISRQRLFDIRRAAMRTAAYIVSMAMLAFIYSAMAFGVAAMLGSAGLAMQSDFNFVYMALALVLAFLFQPVKSLFDKLTSKLMYRSRYDDDEFMREFSRIILHETDLQFFTKQVSSFIAKTLNADGAYFYFNSVGIVGRYITRRASLPGPDVAIISKYCLEYKQPSGVLVTDNVADEQVKIALKANHIGMSLPLILQGELLGFLFVGRHNSRGFSAQDIRAMESIQGELTVAVQNSLFVEEIRELNSGLSQRIEDATKALKSSNRQLQRLDKSKDEFISMASHQLRTPLTSIKGYLDMMLDGDLGKITPTQRSVLSEAYISSERMVTLINDFLNVSRLQTGKFIIDKRETDLAEMLREQVQMLKVVAKQHDLKLETHISKGIPKVVVDGEKVRQVMLNMIDNAIYYSKPSTSIDVVLALDGRDIVFSVKDTGIGVPESEKDGLFGKFFRATNARQKRPDGTGVGLFLSRKVILSHGGDIIFWSKEGKGSIFGFRLPTGLKKANNSGNNDSDNQTDK